MDVGVIGAGTMGMLVVETLLAAGHRVVVHDVNSDALQRAKELGADVASHPRNVAETCTTVLLLLPGPPQIEMVVAGRDGLLEGARQGQTIVDMSTADPGTARRMGKAASARGVDFLDAPILGRPSAIGHWVLPLGGEAAVVERCRLLLQTLARSVVHVGPLGAGHTLKLLNALMFSAINAMTAEMMAISSKAGLPPKVLFETISSSRAATVSGLFLEVGAKIVDGDFSPVFPIDLLCKDNGLAIAMAKACGARPILASSVQVLNELAQARGLGGQDTAALFKVYQDLLNVTPECCGDSTAAGPRELATKGDPQ